jgi:phosphohistidine swiveling domain-containing protein
MKIYDNSNLAESYSGVTTPLTFSFAQYVYQEVYKNFCQMMGVSKKDIKANADMFPDMVVFICGRMYYDLNNWYRLVSLLPGYSFNKGFFEKMLGVEKSSDYKLNREASLTAKVLVYLPRLIWQILKISFSLIFMKRLVTNFNRYFDRVYNDVKEKDFKKFSESELKSLYQNITKDLVARWRVPIANDLAVMISTGVVHKLFEKWLPAADSYEYLYVSSQAPLISLDPGSEVLKIVEKISEDKVLHDLFSSERDPGKLLNTLKSKYSQSDILLDIGRYIEKYGDRMPGELKLESKTIKESPESLINILVSAVRSKHTSFNHAVAQAKLEEIELPFFKRHLVSFVLAWAKSSIVLREETRFKRTLVFGLARNVFTQLGSIYQGDGFLKKVDDVFWLTAEELLTDNINMKKKFTVLVAERKEKYVKFAKIQMPRRIESDKTLSLIEKSLLNKSTPVMTKRKERILIFQGRVASTGGLQEMSGEILVVREFDSSLDFNNKIVVTTHTDPGWSMVFPFIKAIIVERGGTLSHAAIIARELKIPCIIGIESAVDLIKNTDVVKMNLIDGSIQITNG